MYRLDIAQLPGPVTVISLEPMRPADTVDCYIFGDGALDAARFKALRPEIERHIGSPFEFTAIAHLGCAFQPLLLGTAELFGSEEEQSARLDTFFAAAPDTLGAFGSWWLESFAQVQALARWWKDAAIHVWVFLRSMRDPPFEWDDEAVSRWLAERPDHRSCTQIVAEEKDGADGVIFDEWLAQLPRRLAGPPKQAIIAGLGSRRLPAPSVRLSGASSRRVAARVHEITLPLGLGLIGRRMELARLDGVDPSEVRVSLR